jgi:CNT family concentrative nucleoside transporter
MSPADTIFGSWSIEGDTTLILEQMPQEFAADSIITHFGSTGEKAVSLFDEEGTKIGHFDNEGNFTTHGLIRQYRILRLQENFMQLQDEDGQAIYHFSYESPKAASFISFATISRGLVGLAFLLLMAFLFSSNRKAINWNLVGKGIVLQIIIAVLVLKVPYIDMIFENIASFFTNVIDFARVGINFLFGQFGKDPLEVQTPLMNFAVVILPTIIFFSALMSLFYYWGILQKIVYSFAWIMKKFMKLSGAESLAAAGNVFLGQTESPLLVRPYLLGMTKSEMMCLMTGGMATIAGGVLAAYIGFLGNGDPAQEIFYAKHLLTASIISAPAAIVAAKMLVPETEAVNQDLSISKDKIGNNALEAISNGTSDGLKLAVNVGAMLIVFLSLMAMANFILAKAGSIGDLNGIIAANTPYEALSFEMILGYLCGPIMWLLGVESSDMWALGELLGTKTILNEFVAYKSLGDMKNENAISERSTIMATYMLCGFANFASIGIQIGGIGALVPSRKGLLSSLGFRALIGGTIACLFTMVVVGMLI